MPLHLRVHTSLHFSGESKFCAEERSYDACAQYQYDGQAGADEVVEVPTAQLAGLAHLPVKKLPTN